MRPVLTLHLPVPLEFVVAIQRAFLDAYPALAEAPMSEVMRTVEDWTIVFLAPEASA